MDLKTGIILSEFTTYKIGGPADYFVTANTTDDLKEALQWTWSKNLPYKILGKGSNVLISDKGFRGLIIFNSTSSFNSQMTNSEENSVTKKICFIIS